MPINRPKFILNLCGIPGPIGAEIGVFRGLHAVNLLRQDPKLQLYLVDSWEPHKGTRYSVENQLQWMRAAINNVQPFSDRVTIIAKRSVNAAKLIKDRSLDFVYIDAEHTFEAVKQDIRVWTPKLKPGGVMVGDDLELNPVEQAVRECFPDFNRHGNQWFIHEPHLHLQGTSK